MTWPAGISFPKKKCFYYFSIFYYFRLLLLTSVKKSTASPQVTDTPPLIIFMTGTDTTEPFIYHRSHHIHPWLKKTGTCLLKASNILLYYFVSIKSLLSTTLFTLGCIQDTLSSRARWAECVSRAKVSCIQAFRLSAHASKGERYLAHSGIAEYAAIMSAIK